MSLSDEDLKNINPIDNLDKRPIKDIYYLTLAYVVASRSFDPSSKHGCVIVSDDGRILTTGYNGPIKNSVDSMIPLTRPERYYHMLHAEENALLAYNGSYRDMFGSTAYVTGRPCHKCLRMMIQKGIKKLICSQYCSAVVDNEDMKAQDLMVQGIDGTRIDIIEYNNLELVKNLLNNIIDKL